MPQSTFAASWLAVVADQVLVDNDVVLKTACYSLVDEVLMATTIASVPPAILGVARFVIRGRLTRARNIVDPKRATAAFERLLQLVPLVEPNEDELALAADLEAEANRRDLDLDGGESQLLAILTVRTCRLLITGDKRAIVAMAAVAPKLATENVACLEQLVAHILGIAGAKEIRNAVCSEPSVDRALAICFSCRRENSPDEEDFLAALSSYIDDIRRSAPDVMLPGHDLAALAI